VSGVGLALRQVRFTNKAFWRNPASAFFTFAFPLMFLAIFTALLGGGRTEVAPGVTLDTASYYVASMTAFAVITACYTNLAMSVAYQRDAGILKRMRGTPLPGSAYLSGRVMHAMLIALVLVVITTTFGVLFYDASVPTGTQLGGFAVVLLVGSTSFAALGLATTAFVPNADAAPAMVNAIILPLLFLSGVFVPIGPGSPLWVRAIGAVFPVRHFTDAMLAAFYGSPFALEWHDVAIVAAWGIAGLLVGVRYFSWEPRR
jgi:ABC-2 type transport system permease protein